MIYLSSLNNQNCKKSFLTKQSGFTLIEMAVVLVILGFILGGVVTGVSAQREAQKINEARRQITEIREALLGFVQINRRLPCPASLTTDGQEAVAAGNCLTPTATNNSFVPYVDLGIQGQVINGELVDPWLRPVIYRLTPVNNWAYARPINVTNNIPTNFRICRTNGCTPATDILARNVVVVLFSGGIDQATTNTAPTNDFVSDPILPPLTTVYDDQILWISQPELIFAISKTL
jgi:prepilin-type N-terminal cleavage/methylation domain-containing protein